MTGLLFSCTRTSDCGLLFCLIATSVLDFVFLGFGLALFWVCYFVWVDVWINVFTSLLGLGCGLLLYASSCVCVFGCRVFSACFGFIGLIYGFAVACALGFAVGRLGGLGVW